MVSLILAAALTAAIFYIVRMRGMLAQDTAERARSAQREDIRNHVLELLAQGAPRKRVLNAIVGKVEQERPDLLCSILLADGEGKYLYTGAAPSLPDSYNEAVTGSEIAMGVAAFGTAAFTGQREITGDISSHPYWADYREAAAAAGLASCWADVIRFADGKALGVIAVYHREPHLPDAAEIRIVEQAANLTEIALGRSHADQALREHEQMLFDILENVSAHIYMKDREGRYLFANRPLRERLAAPMEEIVGYDDSKFFTADDAAAMRECEMRVLREGEPQEVDEELVNLFSGTTQVFFTVRIPLVREDSSIYALCGISTDISKRKDVEEHMQHMAQYDNLTHLPNRALFEDRLRLALATAQRNSARLALMFIDLDRFKPVNDNYGHAVGDLLLKEVAQRLQDCLRESDTAARVGGDEFVVLLPLVETEADAELVAGKILAALNRPFRIAGHRLDIGGSIGVAVFPDHGEEEHVLVKSADIAMYHAKKSGRNNIKLYHVGLQEQAKQAG
ncbi:MAG TPA: diguanylate cyclase [Gallionellaceae bacterium]|nr:diguanylate cyclase [Gallionellaceae bacterium]